MGTYMQFMCYFLKGHNLALNVLLALTHWNTELRFLGHLGTLYSIQCMGYRRISKNMGSNDIFCKNSEVNIASCPFNHYTDKAICFNPLVLSHQTVYKLSFAKLDSVIAAPCRKPDILFR